MLTLPKDTPRLRWTSHIKNKMIFYNLSAQQVLRVLRMPERREEGVAQNTVAAMRVKKTVSAKNPKETEIWIMYKIAKRVPHNVNRKERAHPDTRYKLHATPITMISAWRYPGRTKPGSPIPIPEDIKAELEHGSFI